LCTPHPSHPSHPSHLSHLSHPSPSPLFSYLCPMSVRIDKFLWSVRIFKTRAQATDACRKGWITIGGMSVKPSRSVAAGEVVSVRKMPVIYRYRVIQPVENRVGAKLVNGFIEDITPKEELDKLKMQDAFFVKRERGSGRPTKKERREMDEFLGD
ncbi:MAG: RNA-binding S4 domain-containing protein, partial [Bacteroidota bacterium]